MKHTDFSSIPNKKERIKWFMEKLENVGYRNSGSEEYLSKCTALFELSNKILATFDFTDEIKSDPKLLKDIEDNLLMDIALCLNDPPHLSRLFGEKLSDGDVVIYLKKFTYPYFFFASIGNYFDLLTPLEKDIFGNNISFIKRIIDYHDDEMVEGRYISIIDKN